MDGNIYAALEQIVGFALTKVGDDDKALREEISGVLAWMREVETEPFDD